MSLCLAALLRVLALVFKMGRILQGFFFFFSCDGARKRRWSAVFLSQACLKGFSLTLG